VAEERRIALDLIFEAEQFDELVELARLAQLRREGACHGMRTSTFYPRRGKSAIPAKSVCWPCPVQSQCLAYALEHHELHGIWGGTSEKERRALQTLCRDGVPIEDVVARTLAGDLEQAMASRRTLARPPAQPYGLRWHAERRVAVRDEAEQRVLARLRRWAEDGVAPGE
jgi:hypothetical protein